MNGIERITAERNRQIVEEGYTADHDADHTDNELAWAAACYAAPQHIYILEADGEAPDVISYFFEEAWPPDWGMDFDKRKVHDRIKQLTIAGALCAAEIDRLLSPPK